MTLTNFSLADLQSLGSRLPNDPHAVSAALPHWQDVIDYEEGKMRVIDALNTAYPRFMFHPLVNALAEHIRKEFTLGDAYLTIYPTYNTALDALRFIKMHSDSDVEIIIDAQKNLFICCTGNHGAVFAKAHWQHTGLGISSRHAERALRTQTAADADFKKTDIRGQLAKYAQVPAEAITLHPSGMSSLYMAYKLTQHAQHGDTVQLGFPYVDTLKIQEKWGTKVHMIDDAGDYLSQLENIFSTYTISACFTELPSNPLLRAIDIKAVSQLCRTYHVMLVVDDTIATCYNIDVRPYADIQCTSLTKGFSGKGNVMAGAMMIHPNAPHAQPLLNIRNDIYEDTLHPDDARVLHHNLSGFDKRMMHMNDNAAQLAQYLDAHHQIDTVYYPSLSHRALYDVVKTPHGGYGCLLSFTLKDPNRTPAFYNELNICKGPSLGTEFSLCCPYTLLAHYHELDWAQTYAVPPHLLRVSAGCEPVNDIIARFESAFSV